MLRIDAVTKFVIKHFDAHGISLKVIPDRNYSDVFYIIDNHSHNTVYKFDIKNLSDTILAWHKNITEEALSAQAIYHIISEVENYYNIND